MRARPSRLVSSVASIVAALIVSIASQGPRAETPYLRVIDDGPSGVAFDVLVPLDAVTLDVDADGRRTAAVEGLAPFADPGRPELPALTVSVGIPDGTDVALDWEQQAPTLLPGPAVRAVPRFDPATRVWRDLPDPAIYRRERIAGPWPATPVTLEVLQYRDLRIARVQIWPLRYDPATEQLEHHARIGVRLAFRPTTDPGARTFHGRGGPAVERLASSDLLNGATVLRMRREQEREPSPVPADSPASPDLPLAKAGGTTTPGVRIQVDTAGLIAFSGAELSAVGFDRTAVDPRNLEISYRGTPLPCRVTGEDDGVFDPGDVVAFYGIPAETRHAQENVYWLAAGTAPGLRFATLDATPGSARLATTYDHTVHVEDGNSVYAFDQGSDEGDPHFFWEVFQEGLTEQFIDFARVQDLVPGDPALLRVSFLGRTDSVDDPDHRVRFRIRGNFIGETTWNGRTPHLAEIPFDSNLMIDGNNSVRVEYLPISFPDSYYMDWFEVVYPRATTAFQDALTIVSDASRKRYAVDGFGDADVLVLDVTDPFAPVRLTGTAVSGSGSFEVAFEVDPANEARYHLASAGGGIDPAALELDVPSNLRDVTNGADLIIVTPEGWENRVAGLVAHRESLGTRVVLANLVDVADEFAGGNVDDGAIRDFVQYAYENWQAPAVSFLLLVGEPSLDPRNWLEVANPINLMPTHFTVTNALGDTMSDTWFGAVAGGDLLPDVAVGRFSVNLAGAATNQADKTIDYETFGWNGSPWTRRIMLVASNETAFEDTLDDALVNVPPDISIVREYRRLGATTESIVASFDESALVTSFIGHGNVTLWADVPGGTFLRGSDVATIQNGRLFPLVTVMNCLNGLIGDPINSVSLAESFHSGTFHSALAVWSPTTLGFLSEYRRLQAALFESIYVRRHSELGTITTETMNRTFLNLPLSIDMVKGMLLLGDPAASISFTCNTTNYDLWCNGIDDDCDGEFDEDYASEPTTCGFGPCANTGQTVCNGGVVEDGCDPLPPPSEDDTTCDSVDEDCDGIIDDDFVSVPTSCGVGACGSTGTTYCFIGEVRDTCFPGDPLAGDDPTCDAVDDDCDGVDDEDYAAVSTECGVGACLAIGATSCSGGVVEDDCVPNPPLSADDPTCDAVDDDCDGAADEDYGPLPTDCGVGACAATGTTECVTGQVLDTCLPGEPAATDPSCDAIDDDCDGVDDDDYAPEPTTCGVGACAAGGATFCAGGQVEDSCVPGEPAANDAVCNAIDDDCDGPIDEDYVPEPTTCGVGACASAGETFCAGGQVSDSCVPGEPAANDAACNAIDDDCDGPVDEDYVPTPTTCGVGACEAAGETICVSGTFEDTCVPLDPQPETCQDTIDNDCDGDVNENDAIDAPIWFADTDGDGFGDPAAPQPSCLVPPGFVADATDCNDAEGTAWATPGEVGGLRFDPASDDVLLWNAPAVPGGVPAYRGLRSNAADDFVDATCLASGDPAGTSLTDSAIPLPGQLLAYLVRAENACPLGLGTLGPDSAGVERSGNCAP